MAPISEDCELYFAKGGVYNFLAFLDVRVLDENRNEVELKENIDYGDSGEFRFEMEGERRGTDDDSFARNGYQTQEFEGEELVTVDEEEFSDDFGDEDFSGDEL